LEWLECKDKDAKSNLTQWFKVFYLNKIQKKLDCGGGGIVG
jgi:hypothetical protein